MFFTPQVWPKRRLAAAFITLALMLLSLISAIRLLDHPDLNPEPDEYDINAWEVRHFASKWLFLTGNLLRGSPDQAEEDALVRRFLQLNREIDSLERAASGSATLREKQQQRQKIENEVEAIIEARLSRAFSSAGLTRTPLAIVWPPVDFEFTTSPRTLAISPRDRIHLDSTTLLREDLSLAEIEALESDRQRQDNVSALAFPTSGIGAYPNIVAYPLSYTEMLELTAHEWSHNYLFFRPLGFNYYKNADLRAMNETVADLIGKEVAAAVARRWPLSEDASPVATPETTTRSDAAAALRKLRLQVDALLAEGKIGVAEALMEQQRLELVANGFFIRKLNQAYFAFVNLYAGEAGNPAATNPIGPKIDELRRRSSSLKRFVERVSSFTSIEELDKALGQ